MVYQKFRYTAKKNSLKMSCADPETFVWRAGYYRPYSGFAIEMAFRWPADCGPPGVLGIWGESLFIFMDLRSTGNYFRGAGEQAHSFGDLGSPAKKQKNKGKASILFDFLKNVFCFWGDSPQTPLLSAKSNRFRIACTSTWI